MKIESIYKDISNFLLELIDKSNDWEEAVLNIEIQPGVLGLNGYFVNKELKRISLRTKPTEELSEKIKLMHNSTATDYASKWNKFKLAVDKNLNIKTEFIWDQNWQNEIDQFNIEEKKRNSNYQLPKWNWE